VDDTRDGVDGATDSAAGGRARASWVPPVLTVIVVQAVFLAAVLFIARRNAPPPSLIPADALALPGETATLSVRLHQEGAVLSGPDVGGLPVTLRAAPGSPPTPDLGAITDASGAAFFGVAAPQALGMMLFEASLGGNLHTEPPSVQVLLSAVPADRALIFMVIPEALEEDLEAQPADSRVPLPAAAVIADLGKSASLAYVADPAWRNAPGLRGRLDAWGLPRGPILGTGAVEGNLRDTVKALSLSRWTGPRWAIVGKGKHATDFSFHGARAVLRARLAAPEVDETRIFHAANWGEARKKILENLKR
jgi:hypothetical protein